VKPGRNVLDGIAVCQQHELGGLEAGEERAGDLHLHLMLPILTVVLAVHGALETLVGQLK
jgi:hypothetical protein